MNGDRETMEHSYETIEVITKGPVAHIRLQRPERRNALSALMLTELGRAFRTLEHLTLSGIVLSGAGSAFCAGADIGELHVARVSDDPAAAGRRIALAAKSLLSQIEDSPCPTIACVDGPAVGGGLELVLACDTIYATPDSHFALPEPTLGLLPGFGGVRRLVERVGPGLAAEMVLTGRALNGVGAQAHGLATRLAPRDGVLREAVAALSSGPRRSRAATAMARQALRAAVQEDRSTAFAEETRLYGIAFTHQDSDEGIRAFLAKRPPEFSPDDI
ncbi:enoyl-CoA hydratase/isomerase family protein [Microbacterium oxydans]|uniref:enoyl-CoA hydratase/isomerase family protein n=1 Tax=Microbacterium oxydans TaxID=82380 RepID=UPI0011436E9B|nr:enoyl-CoA hydratase/isomerase family protein [Microbacterium oxydans]KAB1889825.1 enoyl-CoA hydratase/isomerase family protein [Microbacterium oxydans]GED40217.1 3-hydroxybutyryl-CoA dehydratase [Microbacterium oxydans]